VLAQPFHVVDEVVGGVGGQADGRIRGAGPTFAAVALVEQDDPEPPRVEGLARAADAPAAGAAVHAQRGLAVGIAAGLPVDPVAVADVEQAGRIRFDERMDGHATGR
jgi:hypothetical protein